MELIGTVVDTALISGRTVTLRILTEDDCFGS